MIGQGRMPVLFLGHGSPMNAITDNAFTNGMKALGRSLPTPKAILVISAHWMTEGTWLTNMQQPKTIHDFYGFPKELFDIQYPAPGNPSLALSTQQLVTEPSIQLDNTDWGLDHGTWSVLRHMYPDANIPVVQLSLDMSKPSTFHFNLGQKLQPLREQGVLIVGSGNIVHNLKRVDWNTDADVYDWAIDFDEWVKKKVTARDFHSIVSKSTDSEAGKLSIPTPDHFFPFLYTLGAATTKDELHFDIEGFQNASVSMRSVRFG